VSFSQTEGGKVKINLQLDGLVPNTFNGWHIHDKAVNNQNFTTAGGHFNPKNVVHGAPDAEVRHYGDFGNFKTDDNGHIDYTIEDRLASLFGEFTIQGRGVVIHELEDDLGLVDNDGSRAVGNAGGRLACGNIVIDKVSKKTASVDKAKCWCGYQRPRNNHYRANGRFRCLY
jgi:Cu-Zn family superoxide dismutase